MLIPCPACTRQVSVEAAHCPGCGHPIAGEASVAAIPPETGKPAPGVGDEAVETPEAASAQADEATEHVAEGDPAAPDLPAGDVRPSLSSYAPLPRAADSTYSVRPQRAIDVPGSVPAAILLLAVFVLGLIDRMMSSSTGGGASGGVTCVTLILGIGLLRGGSGFRDWGVFSHLAGLVVWPLVLLTGLLGPAGPGSYLGFLFNVGILMLLMGQPSLNRVRAGVTVAVLGILISGVASVLFPPSPARSAGNGEAELVDTSFLQGVSTHEPQAVSVAGEFGGLTLTVPAELPELQPEAREPRAETGEIEARTSYLGKLDNVSLGLVAFRAAPGYEYNFNAVADQMLKSAPAGLTFRELSRAREQVAGKPALRLIFELKGVDGSLAYTRYQWVVNGTYAYWFTITTTDQNLLQGEAVTQLLGSLRFPSK